MIRGKEIENQSKNIIEKWYKINDILLKIFFVWLCFIPLGYIIIPYNYYYYNIDQPIYDRGVVIKDKLSIDLWNGAKSFFLYRNRQNMYLNISDLDVSNIYLEKIEIKKNHKK